MKIIGWHGGWGNFKEVSDEYFGTGEGQSQGWGFYLAENRKGGEYFATYSQFLEKQAFLYKVKVEINPNEFWREADKNEIFLNNWELFSYPAYQDLRQNIGNIQAAKYLRSSGIKAFMLWEMDNPRHGCTYIVLDPRSIQIIEQYELIDTQSQNRWKRKY